MTTASPPILRSRRAKTGRLVRSGLTLLAALALALSGSVTAQAEPPPGRPDKPTVADPADAVFPWQLTFTRSPSDSQQAYWPYAQVTLTATTNLDVGPTPYWIQISGSGGVLVNCAYGTTCSTTVTSPGADQRNYTAQVIMLTAPYTSVAIEQQTLRFVSTKVTLRAAANTVTMGSTATLIATNTRDLSSGPYYAQTWDADTGQRVGVCGGGTTCNVAVTNLHNYASTRKFITYVGLLSNTFPPPQAIAVSKPTWVTWSNGGYTIWLGPEINSTSSPVLATTNKSVTGVGVIQIMDVETNLVVATCSTGTTCSYQGFSSYVAFVVPWGITASSNTSVKVPPIIH